VKKKGLSGEAYNINNIASAGLILIHRFPLPVQVGMPRLYRNKLAQNAYITQPALFTKHNRICTSHQTKAELLHSLQFTAPCGDSNALQKTPNTEYTMLLCKPRHLFFSLRNVTLVQQQ